MSDLHALHITVTDRWTYMRYSIQHEEVEYDYRLTCPGCDGRPRMGWGPGTHIVGDEGYGPTTITITAVGQEDILAKADGRDENTWTLEHRDWQLAEPAPTDHTAAIAEAAREYVAAMHAANESVVAHGMPDPNAAATAIRANYTLITAVEAESAEREGKS